MELTREFTWYCFYWCHLFFLYKSQITDSIMFIERTLYINQKIISPLLSAPVTSSLLKNTLKFSTSKRWWEKQDHAGFWRGGEKNSQLALCEATVQIRTTSFLFQDRETIYCLKNLKKHRHNWFLLLLINLTKRRFLQLTERYLNCGLFDLSEE